MSRSSHRLALDMDTALIDEQWEKLEAFLSGKLSDADMQTVEDICRNGGDAPAGPVPGAADSARRQPRGSALAKPVAYDAKTFPHSGRLKG